ncbi:ubiquinone biosynthesis methyltransferase UbiE [Leisingera sp. ANG-M1]|nr:ubiquinone biosynthesis methyltransferase UbiE [Leisingera sp. ANG-M1]
MEKKLKTVDIVKWIATAIQLVGYGLTGMNVAPWNVYAFFVGIILWFLVGVMWKDRAIMVVHVGALIALVTGFVNS